MIHKGVFTVPYRWRSKGKDTFYLCYRHDERDPHIILCPKENFDSVLNKLPDLAFMNPVNAKSLLSIAYNLEECTCDKQGRIGISEELKKLLNLDKKMIIAGAINHAQIWSPSIWESYKLTLKQDVSHTSEILSLINQ